MLADGAICWRQTLCAAATFAAASLLPVSSLVAQESGDRAMFVICRDTGGENISPAMASGEACAAFVPAFQSAVAAGGGPAAVPAHVSVDLTFTRTGVARAEVQRAGEGLPWFDASLAVSDRPLDQAAVERLAVRVAERLRES